MPHDKSGQELKVGDKVMVSCTVTSVQSGADYCNLNLETDEPMYPDKFKSSITLNAKQVVKAPPADPREGETVAEAARRGYRS